MSIHSYSKCWVHLIWGTHNREKIIAKDISKKLSKYFYDYAKEKKIYCKTLFINPDHVHMLIDLPINMTVEDTVHLLKGSSSNWINKNNFLNTKFAWSRGYGAFSVSESIMNKIFKYIQNQE
ncbi:MAG: IS200/IS605 family transposase [Ignavibacteriales bacterium]|nr:IS200/IS605 family transposase [Ignavibacteriales bacterium]